MMEYLNSPIHLKIVKVFSSIATGKVLGYESETLPIWSDDLKECCMHLGFQLSWSLKGNSMQIIQHSSDSVRLEPSARSAN